jgi:hypothetical protein
MNIRVHNLISLVDTLVATYGVMYLYISTNHSCISKYIDKPGRSSCWILVMGV